MKKDDYFVTIMQAPPKQHIPIVQFDVKTQKEAFTVSAEGLKGVCLIYTGFLQPFLFPYHSGMRLLSFSNPHKLGKIARSASVPLTHRFSSNHVSYHLCNLHRKS